MTAMNELLDLGQSVWLDYLNRELTRSGKLSEMIDNGLRGVTSNPTIFEQALVASTAYDATLRELAGSTLTDEQIYDTLAIQDTGAAADVLLPVYRNTNGADGFVSIEVAPRLARDTHATISEARRLWRALSRPNVMIKIPGTREGWPAIEQCLREGINVNITLLFSAEHYQAVADAYMRALEARVAQGQPIDQVASVASLFVSRVDTEVDKRIEALGGPLASLRGTVAIANARLVYAAFLDSIASARWKTLAARGARLQRPLWASTSTKNPRYYDVRYIQWLIGANTVTTIAPYTLASFERHGVAEITLSSDVATARRTMSLASEGGIDFIDVHRTLENEGIRAFERSVTKAHQVIRDRRIALGSQHLPVRSRLRPAASTS